MRVRNVLRQQHLGELYRFLETDPLFVFDYDGTLCPIVDYAAQAALAPSTRKLLKTLCSKSTCALLSGRGRADALSRVRGIHFAEVVGSHGEDWASPRPGDAVHRQRAARWFRKLQADLGS